MGAVQACNAKFAALLAVGWQRMYPSIFTLPFSKPSFDMRLLACHDCLHGMSLRNSIQFTAMGGVGAGGVCA